MRSTDIPGIVSVWVLRKTVHLQLKINELFSEAYRMLNHFLRGNSKGYFTCDIIIIIIIT